MPQLQGCGQVSNVSPFLALNLKHFTDRKAGAARSGRKIRERLPRSAVRASRKDLYFHVYVWHFSSFPGKSLASRVCLTDNATFFNISPSQYCSTSLMEVFFYVLLYDGHKILTLAEAWWVPCWATCWRVLTERWRWRSVIDVHLPYLYLELPKVWDVQFRHVIW